MEIKLPSRLAVNGNGETKCVVFARDFFAAKRALAPYCSGVIRSYPFISAFGATVNVHDVADLATLPAVRAIAAHTTVTACGQASARAGKEIHRPYRRKTYAVRR